MDLIEEYYSPDEIKEAIGDSFPEMTDEEIALCNWDTKDLLKNRVFYADDVIERIYDKLGGSFFYDGIWEIHETGEITWDDAEQIFYDGIR